MRRESVRIRPPDRVPRRPCRHGGVSSLAAALAIVALPAAAALYKWTDANGRVIYSDQPPPGNVKVESINAPPPPANPNAAKELAAKEADLAAEEDAARRRGSQGGEGARRDRREARAVRQGARADRGAGSPTRISSADLPQQREGRAGVHGRCRARARSASSSEAWVKENCFRPDRQPGHFLSRFAWLISTLAFAFSAPT